MKERAERIAARALKDALEVLDNKLEGITEALAEMDATHEVGELVTSRDYCALIAIASGLSGAKESAEYWINRQVKR